VFHNQMVLKSTQCRSTNDAQRRGKTRIVTASPAIKSGAIGSLLRGWSPRLFQYLHSPLNRQYSVTYCGLLLEQKSRVSLPSE
jgi:hypothetical protein